MSRRLPVSVLMIATIECWVLLAPGAAAGQTAAKATVQTWESPRTSDGQPDVQGFYKVQGGPNLSLTLDRLEGVGDLVNIQPPGTHANFDEQNKGAVVDPPDGRIPYQPWARAKKEQVFNSRSNPTPDTLDPVSRCLPPGIPRSFFVNGSAFQIVQPPGHVVFLLEYENLSRIVPLDGRPRIGPAIKQWMGDSRGHWEGATLVINTTNFNDRAWLDLAGDFHSDALNTIERLTFGPDTITYEVRFEDPKVFARPWTISTKFNRLKEPNFELLEFACWEGERDADSMLGISQGRGK
jgi:hypothetical protein